MAFFATAVESPLTATLKRPISSVPKVAVVEGSTVVITQEGRIVPYLILIREKKAV